MTRDRLYERYISDHVGSASNPAFARVLRRDLLPWLPQGSTRCLDLGCGPGALSAVLRDAGISQSFGVDISPEQVAAAHDLGRDFVRLDDVQTALSNGERWDVITAFDLLEHLTHDEVLATFSKVNDALTPGGIFVARVPNGAGPLSGSIRYGDFTHRTFFTSRSLIQLGNATGFADVQTREVRPLVHTPASAGRRVLWTLFSAATKSAMAAETGQLRGHLVTSNIMAYLTK